MVRSSNLPRPAVALRTRAKASFRVQSGCAAAQSVHY
jgi:hypothetical protein